MVFALLYTMSNRTILNHKTGHIGIKRKSIHFTLENSVYSPVLQEFIPSLLWNITSKSVNLKALS